jgi:hypothetical protein
VLVAANDLHAGPQRRNFRWCSCPWEVVTSYAAINNPVVAVAVGAARVARAQDGRARPVTRRAAVALTHLQAVQVVRAQVARAQVARAPAAVRALAAEVAPAEVAPADLGAVERDARAGRLHPRLLGSVGRRSALVASELVVPGPAVGRLRDPVTGDRRAPAPCSRVVVRVSLKPSLGGESKPRLRALQEQFRISVGFWAWPATAATEGRMGRAAIEL